MCKHILRKSCVATESIVQSNLKMAKKADVQKKHLNQMNLEKMALKMKAKKTQMKAN
ncbi:Uncharacterised protein [Acinetobacter baumannii]|nr:Uncharacterised protein [Acinetobacter baumannii]